MTVLARHRLARWRLIAKMVGDLDAAGTERRSTPAWVRGSAGHSPNT
jgi:hypothetical protein